MEAPLCTQKPSIPTTETLKRRLLKRGVYPTPKIIHTLRKKETLKSIRKSKRLAEKTLEKPLSESQTLAMEEEARFRTISREYRTVSKMLRGKNGDSACVGKPWEREEGVDLTEFMRENMEFGGGRLRRESLEELKQMMAERNGGGLGWLLDDDFEEGGPKKFEKTEGFALKRTVPETEAIRFFIDRLIATNLGIQDWKFSRLMSHSGIHYTERSLLRIVERLGALGHWKHALSVVEWVYKSKVYKHYKSRFVYTKLLAVLGKARRPSEALCIFNMMREDCQIYPDMPAYHSIAVTLGQVGLVKELLEIIECMRQKPSKRIKNMRRNNWDRSLEPDVVIFNAVLNACASCQQWKGVSWVLNQMRQSGIKPSGATYGLAMEAERGGGERGGRREGQHSSGSFCTKIKIVMLKSGKYDLVHYFFGKLRRSGLPPKALTYKVLVKAFWEEGKVNDAIEAVSDMENRGVVGTASVYYELACCLCYYGKWQESMLQVEKLKKLPLSKPLEVTFTGMIQSCMDGGNVDHCTSVFEGMKDYCAPNIGTINAMLKVYGRNDMFARAKELFEETKRAEALAPDCYSYRSMLEASASAHQWDYFEHVYKEMALCGCQLDQTKHAWVLVEASKAGKWHLLDHAFDLILEAGEIPHLSLFTEMICQNILRGNYERVVPLLNCMGHASLQVSEKEWTGIFRRKRDRIGQKELQELLNILQGSDIMTGEAVISNMLKSLHCLRVSDLQDYAHVGIVPDGLSLHCKDGDPSISPEETPLGNSCDTVLDTFSVYHTDESDEEDCFDLGSFSNNRAQSPDHNWGDDVDDETMSKSSSLSVQNSVTETTLDLLIAGDDGCDETELPTPSEILKVWRENRTQNGVLF